MNVWQFLVRFVIDSSSGSNKLAKLLKTAKESQSQFLSYRYKHSSKLNRRTQNHSSLCGDQLDPRPLLQLLSKLLEDCRPDDVRRLEPQQPNIILDAPLRSHDGRAVLVRVVAAILAEIGELSYRDGRKTRALGCVNLYLRLEAGASNKGNFFYATSISYRTC